MKKVSVIVPAYNVENHIAHCLTELVSQTLDDIEIIVVNDGSKDNSKAVIEDFAARYPDKIKAFTIENRGAAGARNYGLEQATGEYIGFVDSDDFAEREMFEKMYHKAKETNSDIVSCGYYRIVDGIGDKRGCYPYPCFGHNVYDEPSLLVNNLPYIWNKIFRRELVQQVGGFDPKLRIYEDMVFTYKLMLLANRIDLVAEPFYCYTVSREESLTSVFSDKRFDIFTASDDIIRFYREHGALAFFEDELLFNLLKHLFVVMEYDIPASSIPKKNKFINMAFRYLNTTFPWWRDYGYYYKRYKKNKRKYTSKLWWKSFFIIKKKPRKMAKAVLSDTKSLGGIAVRHNLGGTFHRFAQKPLDEKAVVIQSQHGNNLSGNMFYILRELSKEKYSDLKLYVPYNKEKKAEFTALIKAYGFSRAILVDINTEEYAGILATSKYLFNDTSFAAYFMKREGQVYLNTWHGTPLKTLGKSSITDFYDIANLQKNFVSADYLLYPNEYTRDNMLRDYMLPDIFGGNILLSGYPRNEIFFDTARRAELKKKLKLDGKQVIAYMPTWRGNVRKVDHKKHVTETQNYLKYLDSVLDDNQVLYVNFHPFVSADMDISSLEKVKMFPAKYETYDFLNIADILITDYSSVMFDYSLTGGKVILFTYDEEDYLSTRGLYLDFDKLPFARVNTVKALADEINNPEKPDISALLGEFCQYDRGDISAQICDMVIGGKDTALNVQKCTPEKETIFLFAGDALSKSSRTDAFLHAVESAKDSDTSYYVSYVTEDVKVDTEELFKISQHIHFMGQLREFTNASKRAKMLLGVLMKSGGEYKLHRHMFDEMFTTEFTRIFAHIPMKAVIGFGELETDRVYTIAKAPCKKLLYFSEPTQLNRKVSKSVYSAFDLILTKDKVTADAVKAYCPAANVKEYCAIERITEFEQFV
ncbi:MAG: glycosyltransferase [Ruminococcaceae bacterium]|nr:glycosyltransferase [Oscillospiraceae bacterium]